MNARRTLTVLAAILLPLPFVTLMAFVLFGQGAHPPSLPGDPVVPMLSREGRAALPTYEQECEQDVECDSPLRCFYNMRTGRQYCADSTCETNEDCEKDFVCRSLRTLHGQKLVRACSLEGLRREGEMCEALPGLRIDGCERGLICNHFCGRSCRMDQPTSCPDGFVCKQGINGPSCQPTCEGRTCPRGQRCVTSRGGLGSTCMKVYGPDCELHPCDPGFMCMPTVFTTEPGRTWMECLRMCAKSEPRCPDGQTCSLFQCRPACDPEGPSTCEPGFGCLRNDPGQPWACMPNSRAP